MPPTTDDAPLYCPDEFRRSALVRERQLSIETSVEKSPSEASNLISALEIRAADLCRAMAATAYYEYQDWHQIVMKEHRKVSSCCKFFHACRTIETNEPRITVNRCKARTCPNCRKLRSIQNRIDVRHHIEDFENPIFFTLTLKADGRSCTDRMDRLIHAFRKLRQSQPWKSHVKGGLWTFETTFTRSISNWHTHIHGICDADDWDGLDLAAAWYAATGDSHIVDWQPVHDQANAAAELAKYVNKASRPDQLPPLQDAEFIAATRSRRLINRFGTSHGRKFRPDPDPDRPKLQRLASLNAIESWANKGHPLSIKLWSAWAGFLRGDHAAVTPQIIDQTFTWTHPPGYHWPTWSHSHYDPEPTTEQIASLWEHPPPDE